MQIQIPLDYGNSLPNFHNTWPRMDMEVYTQGSLLITKRRIIISGGISYRSELITESIDHILAQVLTENEWQQIGQATRLR